MCPKKNSGSTHVVQCTMQVGHGPLIGWCSHPMEDAGACVGIRAFLLRENEQSVVQVQGRIKAQPEDFVVREISADHEVLDLPEQDGDERVPTEQDREAVLQRLIAAKEAAAVSSSAQKKPRMEFAEPAQGWRHALSETIGESNVASVTEVAAQSREQWLLDAPTEQRDRIFLQICIQVIALNWLALDQAAVQLIFVSC